MQIRSIMGITRQRDSLCLADSILSESPLGFCENARSRNKEVVKISPARPANRMEGGVNYNANIGVHSAQLGS
jgi:hypothetical protein